MSGGTPTIERALAPATGIISITGGTPGISVVVTVGSGNSLNIGGNIFLFDQDQPARITKGLSRAWSATFSVVYTSGTKPVPGDEVALFWTSVKRFGGLVQTVAETRIKGPASVTRLLITCTGFESYLTRTVAAKLYTIATSGWPIIIFDLWANHLAQFGVSLNYPQGPSTGFNTTLLHYIFLAEVFNRIRDENAGWDYWISDNKELIFSLQGTYTAAPFTLRDGDVNQDQITVTRNNAMFRNKQWVLPSVDLTSLLTESFTATAGQITFETGYPQSKKPIVTNNTVNEAVTVLGTWDGSPWYYIPDGIGVFRSPGASALAGGEAIAISYPNPFPIGYSAEDDTSIAAVGLYESVYQSKNIVDALSAQALAAALLALYGTSGDFPESIVFLYNSHSQSEWLLPGMMVDVNRTFPDAVGNYVVEEVDSQLDQLSVWRHAVTLRLGQGDVSGTFEADFLQAGRLWVNTPPTLATFEIGIDTNLIAAVQPNTYRFRGSGIIASWDARTLTDPPTGASLIIDLLLNGTSIFPAGNPAKINIGDGVTAEQGGFIFVSQNLAYSDGDVMTMSIIQVGSTTPGKNGLVHLNLKPNAALPPA